MLIVGLEHACQQADEGGLAHPVFAQHDDDLRVGELARLHVQLELPQVLDHLGVLVPQELLGFHLLHVRLRHLEGERLLAEAQVLGGHKAGQEDVDALPHAERQCDHAVRTWLAVQAADEVGKVVQHREVVLHDDHKLVGAQQVADHLRRLHALPHVQVGGRLIDHVDVRVLGGHHGDRKPLQLSAAQVLHVAVRHLPEVQLLQQLVLVAALVLLVNHLLHVATHRLGDVVHVLRLDDRLDVVLQHAREVVLQLRPAEVEQDLLPVGHVFKPAEVGLELAGQHLQCRRLANAVGADEAQHLTRARHRQPVQLEGVGAVAVGGFALQVLRQVDDLDCLEGTFPDADTAANAQLLRDPCRRVLRRHLNAKLTNFHHRAAFLALLAALLGLAPVGIDDSNAGELVRLIVLLLVLWRHRA
mmetsp:Transcript_35444/g.88930  ORF Transcript_35444/g.88930 Transcript_35444/m.88930 type:complete len:416 (+) Transcript_35444:840-2087(+)